MMAALETQNLTPVAVAVSSLKDLAAAEGIGRLIAARRPAIILNATAFSALREDGTTVLDAADVPVLQMVLASNPQEAWASSPRGLSPTDLAMNVVLPELDGRLLTRAVSFKVEDDFDPRDQNLTAVRHKPCPDRIDFVARQASRWVKLGKTARLGASIRAHSIRLSAGCAAGRAGYAVGLDTAESVVQIVNLLRREGYDVGAEELHAANVEMLLAGHSTRLNIPLGSYAKWLEALPPDLQERD